MSWSWLEVDPEFEWLFQGMEWTTNDRVIEQLTRGESIAGEVWVTQTMLKLFSGEMTSVFFKLYRYPKPSWAFVGRPSKARREFENYGTLRALGLPTANRVAAGEERDGFGRLRSAWIMTEEVPFAKTLVEFARGTVTEKARRKLIADMAEITRTMHASHFYYHDLVWRNILVSRYGADPELCLIDCPRGAHARFGRERHRLRDLASLDKLASKHCRRTERLRFLLSYLGKRSLDAEAKALARAEVEYRRKRWPEDWFGK